MKCFSLIRKLSVASALTVMIAVLPVAQVGAVDMNRNNLIDDSVFDNTSTMDADQIDGFLNGFANSCISPNSGFQAIIPTGYSPSGGFTYGDYVSAGRVIYTAAQVYSLNPQVILTTLQKEQSLVSGAGSSYCENGDPHKYAAAAGYGCPDGGTRYSYTGLSLYKRNGTVRSSVDPTCVNSASKAGFSQQVIRAAWLLKFGQQRSEGNVNWAVVKGSWDNSDDPPTCYGGPMTQGTLKRCQSGSAVYYDGLTTIDGASVHIDTGPTAALYWYTPHFSGNQNFTNIFNGWFGSTYGSALEASAMRMYNPKTRDHYYTGRQNERAVAKTQGYQDDGGSFRIGSAQEAGMIPIYHLYQGRLSDNWLLPDGPALYWAAVLNGYRIDGIAFYAYPANTSPTLSSPVCATNTAPVYQMWHGGIGDHFYSSGGGDHYWGLIYGGYVDDGSSLYKDSSGGVTFCVPTG